MHGERDRWRDRSFERAGKSGKSFRLRGILLGCVGLVSATVRAQRLTNAAGPGIGMDVLRLLAHESAPGFRSVRALFSMRSLHLRRISYLFRSTNERPSIHLSGLFVRWSTPVARRFPAFAAFEIPIRHSSGLSFTHGSVVGGPRFLIAVASTPKGPRYA